jgi:hypothetical protein
MRDLRVSFLRGATIAGWVLIAGSLVGGEARAQGRDPVVADALFREARDLLKDGKYELACPKFAESYRLDPAPGTLFNLAQCEEKQGRLASSLERWRSLIDVLTSTSKLVDPRLPVARERVEALTKRVPRLVLRYKAGVPKETVVLFDGVELRAASLNTELPVEPGPHTVLARAAYRHDGEFKITLKEGERTELQVEPGGPDGTEPRVAPKGPATASSGMPVAPSATGTTGTAPTSGPTSEPPPESLRRPVGLVVAGVGLASLIGAGVTSVMLTSRKDTINNHCHSDTRSCDPEGLTAAQSTGTLVPLNLVLWIVGIAGAGTGGYLFFSAPSGAAAQVSASASGTQTSLWVRGQF